MRRFYLEWSGTTRFRPLNTLAEQFGPIDIYLFDQLLRGRLHPGMRLVDAGTGGGRNLIYLLRAGYDIHGVDANPAAVAEVRALARALAPQLPAENFRVESIEQMSFPDAFADAVLSSAVLHFARDEAQFNAMLTAMWRVLKPGGLFFARLASTIGMEDRMRPLGGRRYHLPDGSDRLLVDAPLLLELTGRLGGTLIDPLKTTVVHDQRCMTTWVARKHRAGES
jgi:tellurite methyltransferase